MHTSSNTKARRWTLDRQSRVLGHTEVINKGDIISLHYNTRRDEDTPENSLGVELDTLTKGHVALLMSCGAGVFDDVNVRLVGALAVHAARDIGGCV